MWEFKMKCGNDNVVVWIFSLVVSFPNRKSLVPPDNQCK